MDFTESQCRVKSFQDQKNEAGALIFDGKWSLVIES